MVQYRRNFVAGGTYFFTVALNNRQSTILVDYVDLLRSSFQHVKQKHPFITEAMVVLPDHLHAIWTLPPGDIAYPKRWQLFKARFTRLVRKSGLDIGKTPVANTAFGNDDTGSTRFGTRKIWSGISTTFITIRSSMGTWCVQRTGPIRAFIGMWKTGCCQETGVARESTYRVLGVNNCSPDSGLRPPSRLPRSPDAAKRNQGTSPNSFALTRIFHK